MVGSGGSGGMVGFVGGVDGGWDRGGGATRHGELELHWEVVVETVGDKVGGAGGRVEGDVEAGAWELETGMVGDGALERVELRVEEKGVIKEMRIVRTVEK